MDKRLLQQFGHKSVPLSLALLSLLVLAACATVPLEPPPTDTPLFRRIDARVGYYCASTARTPIVTNPLVRIEVGRASVERFEQVFASMFSQVVALPDWPPWRDVINMDLDGIIELEKTEAELTLGDDSGKRPDVTRIAYRICHYDSTGTLSKCWVPSAQHSHQRGIGECLFDLPACFVRQMDITMREAIARFMLDAENDPELRAWARRVSSRNPSP